MIEHKRLSMKEKKKQSNNDVTIVPTGCCHDCGGRCVLKAHVKDGKIIRTETGATPLES